MNTEIQFIDLLDKYNTSQNNKNHFGDVKEHTLKMLDLLKDLDQNRLADFYLNDSLKLAIICHDIGKKSTKTTKDGVDHFYGHEKMSVELAKKEGIENEYVLNLIKYHGTKYKKLNKIKTLIENTDRYFVNDFINDMLIIQYLDIMAQSDFNRTEKLNELIEYIDAILSVGAEFPISGEIFNIIRLRNYIIRVNNPKDINKATKGFTHGGTFHADDVFATALLQILNPEIEIERGFKAPPESDDIIIYDIGGGRYDHHQKNKEYRYDEYNEYNNWEIAYSSIGLLWRDFGSMLTINEDAWESVDSFITDIDNSDNTGSKESICIAISSFNPDWDSVESVDDQFWKAVAFAKTVLQNLIDSANSKERAKAVVDKAVEKNISGDKRILVLNKFVPCREYLSYQYPDIYFFIFPSNRGGFNIQTVPDIDTDGTACNRIDFPAEWLGNPDKSFGMTFCHPGNWLASTTTVEEAINVAKVAIVIAYNK